MSRLYHYVPAALEYGVAGLHIYVTYGRHADEIRLMESSPGYSWVRTPDRDLVFVNNLHWLPANRPMSVNYDEMYSFSPFHEDAAKDLDYEYFMVNYTTYIGKEHSSGRTRRVVPEQKKVNIIADSGGFQIYRGDIEYIDPLKLVEWYNDNIDLGMVLDIPSDMVGVRHYERLATIQAKNTAILMDNKREDMELFNVFHGTNPEELAAFRKITERPDIDRLALGGMYTGSIVGTIRKFLSVIGNGHKYKHYHILGVQNLLQVLPFMRIAQTHKTLITSDSSTYLKKAHSKEYYFFPNLSEAPKLKYIGTENVRGAAAYIPSPHVNLPCTCAICSVVKYKDIFAMLQSQSICHAFSLHNLFSSQDYMRGMYDLMETMDTPQIIELITSQFSEGARKKRRKGYINEMLRAFEYIDEVEKSGMAEADDKFKMFVAQSSFDSVASNTLWAKAEKKVVESAEDSPQYMATNTYMERYEKGEGKHGKKIKAGEKETSSKKIMGVKSNKAPGKKKPKAKKKKKAPTDVKPK